MVELTKAQEKEVKKEVGQQVAQAKVKLEREMEQKHKRFTDHLRDHVVKTRAMFKSEFRQQTAAAIIAAFGFLIALAWKDFIVKLMEHVTTAQLLVRYPYISDLFSALIVTIVSVVGIMFISVWVKKGAN